MPENKIKMRYKMTNIKRVINNTKRRLDNVYSFLSKWKLLKKLPQVEECNAQFFLKRFVFLYFIFWKTLFNLLVFIFNTSQKINASFILRNKISFSLRKKFHIEISTELFI